MHKAAQAPGIRRGRGLTSGAGSARLGKCVTRTTHSGVPMFYANPLFRLLCLNATQRAKRDDANTRPALTPRGIGSEVRSITSVTYIYIHVVSQHRRNAHCSHRHCASCQGTLLLLIVGASLLSRCSPLATRTTAIAFLIDLDSGGTRTPLPTKQARPVPAAVAQGHHAVPAVPASTHETSTMPHFFTAHRMP